MEPVPNNVKMEDAFFTQLLLYLSSPVVCGVLRAEVFQVGASGRT